MAVRLPVREVRAGGEILKTATIPGLGWRGRGDRLRGQAEPNCRPLDIQKPLSSCLSPDITDDLTTPHKVSSRDSREL